MEVLVERLDIDTEVNEQLLRDAGVAARVLQGLAAAVAEHGLAIYLELIAPGMSAEVVMIVEHEDSLAVTVLLLPEQGRAESGNATAYDDQVVIVVGLAIGPAECRTLPRDSMSDLE